MIVTPFRGLRPRPDLASRIPSLPYDVLDSDEARRLAAGDPYTFLHVVKSEIDLDPAVDVHDARVYAKARENLDAMRAKGWMVQDRKPSFYVYRQTMGDHVQTGIVGAAAVDDYLEGRVKRHEHTRPDKEDDRTRHAEALAAHPGPVFLAYRGNAALAALVAAATERAADVSFVAPDGVGHLLWVIEDPRTVAAIEAAFRAVPATYIADGHHRAAAYARAATERPGHRRFLAVHFPAAELRILGYHRAVRDLNGLGPAELLMRTQDAGFQIVTPWPERLPSHRGTFGVYLEGGWRLLVPRPGPSSETSIPALDVEVLQGRVLGPVLGIGDPRTDARLSFVGGLRGVDELERRVDSGASAAAFALYPTSLDDVMRVADAGEVMPPKSTWFEPKLRSGMVVHLLDED